MSVGGVIARGVGAALLYALSVPALAEVIDITASFTPDPARPHINEFENTTPDSGFCAENPFSCDLSSWGGKLFSIETGIDVNSTQAIPANHKDPRQGAMFNVNAAQWRDVEVRDSRGNPSIVQVRISGIGGRYRLSERVQNLIGEELSAHPAHARLWDIKDWGVGPSPCGSSRAAAWADDTDYAFLWLTPTPGVCYALTKYDIPGLAYPRLNIAYGVRTPNPLKMAPGVHTGSTTFILGPGADIDMGDVMLPSDNILQMNFTLNVEHVLAVEIPPGGNQVQLVPQEGWQAWLQRRRQPTRLLRDQTFNIYASTPFKMQLSCTIDVGNTCGLKDAAGNRVPVNVAVSLPHGLTRNGQAVNRQPLRLDGQGTERFEPSRYVARKPGTLHFSVEHDDVKQMLDLGSDKFSGEVTVIWDSEV